MGFKLLSSPFVSTGDCSHGGFLRTLWNEVTSRYLELEAAQGVSANQPIETMLTTIKAIYTQLQQPVQSAQAYIDLASQNYVSPGHELELAKFELERITRTLQGLEEVVKTGRMH